MKIHHHSCKCGWSDLDWCQEPGCAYPEQSDVCPKCTDSEHSVSYQALLTERAILGLKIQCGQLSRQSEYDILQKTIANRSGTNLHKSHIERISR